MRAYERFLQYVKVYTTSDPESASHPTTARQLDLGRMLVAQLEELGLKDARLDEYGYVYARLRAGRRPWVYRPHGHGAGHQRGKREPADPRKL